MLIKQILISKYRLLERWPSGWHGRGDLVVLIDNKMSK